jgi:hypothetical protein
MHPFDYFTGWSVEMKNTRISNKLMIIIVLVLAFLVTGSTNHQDDENDCDQGGSGVFLYSQNFFSGLCTKLTEDARDLSDYDIGEDSVNSVKIVGAYMVTLFENTGFGGSRTTFTESDFSLSDNEVGSFTASSARVRNRGCFSSMNFSGDSNGPEPIGVYVFDEASFEGDCARITQDAPDMAQEFLGDNAVRSLYINGSYKVILFEEPNNRGGRSIFQSSAPVIEIIDDESLASSIRIFTPNCGKHNRPGVYLYGEPNFRGRCSRLLGPASDLELSWIGENSVASVRIIGDLQALLYDGEDFTGEKIEINDDILDLSDTRLGRNKASSIRVTELLNVCRRDFEEGVYLFSEDNTGDCTQFTEGNGDLRNFEIGNDSASSILIIGDYQATLYERFDMNGPSTTFTSSDRSFLDDDIGDNRATSIEVLAPYPENEPVLFVEIRLKTADITDAGTDDNVYVSLNRSNSTLLDYPRNDFDRGDDDRYHLSNNGIGEIKDIHSIALYKDGSDGWCVSEVELFINEWPAFAETYEPCIWLDNDNGHDRKHTIRHVTLRGPDGIPENYPSQSVEIRDRLEAAALISHNELDSIFKSEVGNRLHELPLPLLVSSVFWGHFHGDPVEITRPAEDTLHVDLDLGAEVVGWFNPDVDVDFDAVFSCTDGTVKLTFENVDIKTDSEVADLFLDVDFDLDEQTVVTGSTVCPTIIIQDSSSPFVVIVPGPEPPPTDPDENPQDPGEAPEDGGISQ